MAVAEKPIDKDPLDINCWWKPVPHAWTKIFEYLFWNDRFGFPCIPCIVLNNVEKSFDARSVYKISICLK